jgi:hypothetical protein
MKDNDNDANASYNVRTVRQGRGLVREEMKSYFRVVLLR